MYAPRARPMIRMTYPMRYSPKDISPPGIQEHSGCHRKVSHVLERSQDPLNLIAEPGIDPAHRNQQQPEYDEAQNAGQRIEVTQVPEEQLAGADGEQRQSGEAEHAITKREAAG